MDDRVVITREELYERVWVTPMLQLAREFDLSDRGLAKVCARLEIPVPGRGYWRRKETGQKVEKRPLPKLSKSGLSQVTIHKRENAMDTDPTNPELPEPIAYEMKQENRIQVAENPADLHPLILRTAESLRSAKAGDTGLVHPRAKNTLDVTVAPASIDRAIRIMDTLVKALDARGRSVSLSSDEHPKTLVTILNETLAFGLEERLDPVPHVLTAKEKREKEHSSWVRIPAHDFVPSGDLALVIRELPPFLGIRGRWGDGKRARLENRLNRFVIGLIRAADTIRTERERQERQRQEWAERERRRIEAEKRRQEEEKRIRDLKEMMANWRTAGEIRAFMKAVEEEATKPAGRLEPNEVLFQWIAWARDYADRLDPLVQKPQSARQDKEEEQSENDLGPI